MAPAFLRSQVIHSSISHPYAFYPKTKPFTYNKRKTILTLWYKKKTWTHARVLLDAQLPLFHQDKKHIVLPLIPARPLPWPRPQSPSMTSHPLHHVTSGKQQQQPIRSQNRGCVCKLPWEILLSGPTLLLKRKVKRKERRTKDEEEGEGEKDEDEDEDEKGQAGVEEDEEDDNNGDNQKRNPWSHHIDRKCMVPSGCRGYVGPNLKRHLQNVHYQKGHITEQDVDKYFALGLDPKKTRGPKRTTRGGKTIKGRWKRWCPEKASNYLGCYLPEHLQNKHRMKPESAVYKLSFKVARRYQGLEEEPRSIEPNVSQPSIPSPDSTTTKDKKVSPSSVPSHLPLPELPIVEEVTMQSASDEEAIDSLLHLPPRCHLLLLFGRLPFVPP